jgi:hypothetical protein
MQGEAPSNKWRGRTAGRISTMYERRRVRAPHGALMYQAHNTSWSREVVAWYTLSLPKKIVSRL